MKTGEGAHESGLQLSFEICAGEISGRVGGKNMGSFQRPAFSRPSGVNSGRVVQRYLTHTVQPLITIQMCMR
jgi:hypothetical protein